MNKNSLYYFEANLLWLGLVGGCGVVFFALSWLVSNRDKILFLRRTLNTSIDLIEHPALVMDPKGHIMMANQVASGLLRIEKDLPVSVKDPSDDLASTRNKLQSLLGKNGQARKDFFSNEEIPFTANPIIRRNRKRPHWLIEFRDNSSLSRNARKWGRSIQKIARWWRLK